jgi:hypothetical protein
VDLSAVTGQADSEAAVNMTDRDPTAPGQAWMRGELSSEAYFAMVRRQVRAPEPGRRRRWWRRKKPRA